MDVDDPAKLIATKRPASVRTNTSSSLGNSSGVRRIHFNDRVEQWIAVDTYTDDDEHNEDAMQDDGCDTSEDSDSESEEEDGLFLMVRSNSSASLSTLATRRGSIPQGSTGMMRLSIAPLPATTLNYIHDPAEEEDKATKVANAMSHNSTTRRLPYSKYDYSSVYTEAQQRQHIAAAPPSSPPMAPATSQTTPASVAGMMLPSESASASSLLLDQSSGSSSSVDLNAHSGDVSPPRRPQAARSASGSKLDAVKGIATSLWHWKSTG
jgi:hypothetical protein